MILIKVAQLSLKVSKEEEAYKATLVEDDHFLLRSKRSWREDKFLDVRHGSVQTHAFNELFIEFLRCCSGLAPRKYIVMNIAAYDEHGKAIVKFDQLTEAFGLAAQAFELELADCWLNQNLERFDAVFDFVLPRRKTKTCADQRMSGIKPTPCGFLQF